jgi:hypothetical protein
MEVSGQLHASAALSSGNESPVPIAQESGWAPESVCTLWRREEKRREEKRREEKRREERSRYAD